MDHDLQRARAALTAYGLADVELTPIEMGNINETYRAGRGADSHVLQRLNPIFSPLVHHDIAHITEALAAAGMATPRLVPTRDGGLWTEGPGGEIWRLLTYVEGVVYSHAEQPAVAAAAGLLLGRFHRAVWSLPHAFSAVRLGVHDTVAHLAALRAAVGDHPEHVAAAAVTPLAHDILAAAAALPDLGALPARIVHGDPKLNNIVFAPPPRPGAVGAAVALIDLDTLGRLPIALELGDAWRSWCNPGGENAAEVTFSLPHFDAACHGHAAGIDGMLTAPEIAALPAALPTIALELAARFARDALEERYFGWDRRRYGAAWEHNLVRARAQLALARSYLAQRGAAEAVLAAAFGAPP